MSHSVKIYDTCIGCTQCVRDCPAYVLEMIYWDMCKIVRDVNWACPTDFLNVRVYLWHETTRSMDLAY
ncbi:hypothetical protein UlMin_026205 [Ulmus minor]